MPINESHVCMLSFLRSKILWSSAQRMPSSYAGATCSAGRTARSVRHGHLAGCIAGWSVRRVQKASAKSAGHQQYDRKDSTMNENRRRRACCNRFAHVAKQKNIALTVRCCEQRNTYAHVCARAICQCGSGVGPTLPPPLSMGTRSSFANKQS
jgi:hypothetical protein